MVADTIKTFIQSALTALDLGESEIKLDHPGDFAHGDYSTNVALALAKPLGKSPQDVAKLILTELEKTKLPEIEKIEIAGPGFINFYLSREFFTNEVAAILKAHENYGKNEILSGKKVMVEYTQPNPFKPFHIGHLMTNAIGESISRIVEYHGAKVIRANYQGDVGPHVAKAIYGLMKNPTPAELEAISAQALYIGECYAKGNDAYENDVEAKKEIDAINKKIYDRSEDKINELYDWGRGVTLAAFESLYTILGTKFDYSFFESEMAPIGLAIVNEYLEKGIFEKSDGAVVFHGEKYNPALHTRVFVNSQGLPTYETKELGLTKQKFAYENPDLSIVTTAVEQGEYMKVVKEAMRQIEPLWADRTMHITNGMMRLVSGKMASRKGNVVTGESLLNEAMQVILERVQGRAFTAFEREEVVTQVAVAAIKYAILRSAIGGDIVYDFDKSISFEGDSGPYLQYSATRAKSVLRKAEAEGIAIDAGQAPSQVSLLEHLLYRFPEIVVRAGESYAPHHIATYLIELASAFNSFYAETPIVDTTDEYSPYKIALTKSFTIVMKNGLGLLGIQVPEKM
ncbi:arginine--tRNA ligase [Candidatus Nomurabacteria bacterium]|nr:MAG: arginine--tRNA ligase [Candidatus Nomurabacteria bacterium]